MASLSAPNPDIFRAYDVRGIVGESLHADDFRAIGQAFGSHVANHAQIAQPNIVVMRDGRLSSPLLAGAMMEGLLAAGCHVHDGGVGPTPLCYFTTRTMEAHGSVMVTGSHNPPSHNGAKFMLGRGALYGKALAALGPMVAHGNLREATGSLRGIDMASHYIDTLAALCDASGMRIVWDAGNGAAGAITEALAARLSAGTHDLLYTDIDGRFPNHHPDPSDPATLTDLQQAVIGHQADIGIAFDGDGDRVGFVDDTGRILSPDHMLMLFARHVLAAMPGAEIIADVKTSDAFFADVAALGGQATMWQTGHALIKDKLHATGAAFAGEASGHVFFADRYFGFDDGLYAAMRMIALCKQSQQPLSTLTDALPALHASDEIRIACADSKKFAIVRALSEALAKEGGNLNTLDGLRVTTPDGWWLLRASNTQAALVVRYEGINAEALARMHTEVTRQLARCELALPACRIP
jgi:phosphomannomutase